VHVTRQKNYRHRKCNIIINNYYVTSHPKQPDPNCNPNHTTTNSCSVKQLSALLDYNPGL